MLAAPFFFPCYCSPLCDDRSVTFRNWFSPLICRTFFSSSAHVSFDTSVGGRSDSFSDGPFDHLPALLGLISAVVCSRRVVVPIPRMSFFSFGRKDRKAIVDPGIFPRDRSFIIAANILPLTCLPRFRASWTPATFSAFFLFTRMCNVLIFHDFGRSSFRPFLPPPFPFSGVQVLFSSGASFDMSESS